MVVALQETSLTQLVATPARPSAMRDTLASPLYRGATIALFLSGLGFSGAAPQIALFLVNDLHVSLSTAGLYYLTNLTAPVVGYLVGARSDRTGNRLGLFRLCAVMGFLGWLAIAFSTQAWMPFVISAVVLAFAGAASSQLFAAIHDDLQANASPVADGVTSIVRMALTVPLGFSRSPAREHQSPTTLDTGDERSGQIVHTRRRHVLLPLLTFTGLYVLVYAGEPIK